MFEPLIFYCCMIFLCVFPLYTRGMMCPVVCLVSQFIITLIYLGSRDMSYGADIENYRLMYEQTLSLVDVFSVYHGEYMYSLFGYICKSIGFDFDSYLIVFSALMLSVYCSGVLLMVGRKGFFVVPSMFFAFTTTSSFYLMNVNILRQGMAASFVVLTAGLLVSKCYRKSILTGVVAIFLHKTSVLGLVLAAILFRVNSRNINVYSVSVLLLVAGVISSSIFSVVGVLGFDDVLRKLKDYQGLDYSSFWVLIKVVIQYVVLLSLVSFHKISDDMVVKVLALFGFSFLFLSLCFFSVPLVSSRFIYYGNVLMPIIIFYTWSTWSRRFFYQPGLACALMLLPVLLYGMIVVNSGAIKNNFVPAVVL